MTSELIRNIENRILAIIVEQSSFTFYEVKQAYKQLDSLDRLLLCIEKAAEKRRPLTQVVEELSGEGPRNSGGFYVVDKDGKVSKS